MLLLVGLADLMTLSMPQEIWLVHYWGPQAPARIIVFGLLALFTYTTAPSSSSSSYHHHHHHTPSSFKFGTESGSDGLCNRVFFAFAMIEFLGWLWAWVTLREEAAVFAIRKRRRSSTSARERPS